jgi:hypothetical protein
MKPLCSPASINPLSKRSQPNRDSVKPPETSIEELIEFGSRILRVCVKKVHESGLTSTSFSDLKTLRDSSTRIPVTTIAVFGKTNSLKTSLINAVLGCDILPSCTEVPIEFQYLNETLDSEQSIAIIKVLSMSQWREEIECAQQLLYALDAERVTVGTLEGSGEEESQTALHRVQAVYKQYLFYWIF